MAPVGLQLGPVGFYLESVQLVPAADFHLGTLLENKLAVPHDTIIYYTMRQLEDTAPYRDSAQ